MSLKEIHLSMIAEALGVMGKEICQEIVVLHHKAISYDKIMAEKAEETKPKDSAEAGNVDMPGKKLKRKAN